MGARLSGCRFIKVCRRIRASQGGYGVGSADSTAYLDESAPPDPADHRCSRTTVAARAASSGVVRHDETLIRIAGSPCQTVGPHQTRPSACTAATSAVVAAGPSGWRTRTWLSTTS